MGINSRIIAYNQRYCSLVVWILRIIVGCTFIFSGFSKVVDPWGFVYKIDEYLTVWGIEWVSRYMTLIIAVSISTIELVTGVLLLTGCLRRLSCIVMACMMAFLLPLSAYIAIVNPVADCGCFGEALILSNNATLIKNIILSIAIVYLLAFNKRARCLYPPLIQWMVVMASLFYCILLASAGYFVQPLVDFRQFKVGQPLTTLSDAESDVLFEYTKDGIVQQFDAFNLPDSTWTFVGRIEANAKDQGVRSDGLTIFDGDDDVTSDVLSDSGDQVILVVNNPKYHKLARASMANILNDYIQMHDGSMIGIVATSPDSLSTWTDLACPHYDVYTADDTTLKELVRGDAGIVYVVDGIVKWKRNFYSLSGDFPDFETEGNVLDDVTVYDSGYYFNILTAIYIASLIAIFLLGLIRIRQSK